MLSLSVSLNSLVMVFLALTIQPRRVRPQMNSKSQNRELLLREPLGLAQ